MVHVALTAETRNVAVIDGASSERAWTVSAHPVVPGARSAGKSMGHNGGTWRPRQDSNPERFRPDEGAGGEWCEQMAGIVRARRTAHDGPGRSVSARSGTAVRQSAREVGDGRGEGLDWLKMFASHGVDRSPVLRPFGQPVWSREPAPLLTGQRTPSSEAACPPWTNLRSKLALQWGTGARRLAET